MFWRWGKKIGFGFLGLVAVVLLSGVAYQFICTKLEERKYPMPGEMWDVGGYRLHLYDMGMGRPAVVLDAGLGCSASDWGLVQPEIAKFTRVVSYDRAGYGYSEKGPYPRTSGQIVQELHELLKKANIPGPYILVGHSSGGINIQLYAATYPDEVLGLVLVDSAHEEQEKRMPPYPLQGQIDLLKNGALVNFMSTIGVVRLVSQVQKTESPFGSTSKHMSTVSAEFRAFTESLKQLENANRSLIRDKPCFVLTAGIMEDPAASSFTEEQREVLHKRSIVWNELQNDFAIKFNRSRHIIAEKSDHMIPWNEPEIIVQAVKDLIEEHMSGQQL